jgi:hypothetical protein
MGNEKPSTRKQLFKIAVPKDRVLSRGQGCWNCTGWDREKAKPLWEQKRQVDLQTALNIALELPDGEPKTAEEAKTPQAMRCFNIKKMVDSLDHLVASGHVGCCTRGGRTADGNPVGDFVVHSFLCDRWNALAGASLAREGGKLDDLPEEARDKMNNRTLISDEMAAAGIVPASMDSSDPEPN